MGQREGRDDAHYRPHATRGGEQREQEQQMIIAGEDVQDSELDEVEPAGRGRAVDVRRGGPRRLPEDHLALAARRAEIAEALIVLAQKGAPVFADVEATMCGVAGEVDLDGCARLVGAGAANTYSARTAANAGEVDRDASACLF